MSSCDLLHLEVECGQEVFGGLAVRLEVDTGDAQVVSTSQEARAVAQGGVVRGHGLLGPVTVSKGGAQPGGGVERILSSVERVEQAEQGYGSR